MSSPARRAVAVAASALLVAGLAACAPAEPEAQPEPTVTPSATPTPVGPTPPGSRVPTTCEEIFASAVFNGRAVSEAELAAARTPYSGLWVQAGNLDCQFEGEVGGEAARVTVTVEVGTPADSIWWYAGWGIDEEAFFPSIAGEASHLGCQAGAEGEWCKAELVAGGYGASLDFWFDEPDVDIAQDAIAYLNELEALLTSLPAAKPAWQPPPGVLTWSDDCEGIVRTQQDVVRDVVPFALSDAMSNLGPDGSWGYYEAYRVTRSTECGWFNVGEGLGGTVDIVILPGGAWMHDAGVPLGGEPYDLPGALAAAVEISDDQYALSAYIDGSYVSVRVTPPFESGIDPAPIARDIVLALVAQF